MSVPTIERRLIRMATCVHEAGHTTAGLVTGIAFIKVRVISDRSGVVETPRREVPEGMELPEAMTFAAGLAAERIFARREGGEHAERLYDDAWAPAEHDSRFVVMLARDAGLPVSVVRSKAHDLVLKNWEAVMRTARALMTSPTLSYSRTKSVAGKVR